MIAESECLGGSWLVVESPVMVLFCIVLAVVAGSLPCLKSSLIDVIAVPLWPTPNRESLMV